MFLSSEFQQVGADIEKALSPPFPSIVVTGRDKWYK